MKTQMSSKGLDVLLVIENKTVKLIPSAFHVKKTYSQEHRANLCTECED